MTKIDIISGFLGAGKTTFIKKMIDEVFTGEKLVLIENEFGEVGIDGGFLKDAGIQITEMNSGCICCSLVGDFGRNLHEVIGKYHPDRILIEPSGVGKLSDVIGAVRKVTSDDVQLGNFVTVADATKCKMYMKNFGEFYNNQIETANTIILSRTDGMAEEKLDQCVAMIREHNKDAVIVTTPWPELTGEQLMEAMEQRSTIAIELAKLEEEAHHHHHDHDEDDECDDPDCSCHHHHHDDDDNSDRNEHITIFLNEAALAEHAGRRSNLWCSHKTLLISKHFANHAHKPAERARMPTLTAKSRPGLLGIINYDAPQAPPCLRPCDADVSVDRHRRAPPPPTDRVRAARCPPPRSKHRAPVRAADSRQAAHHFPCRRS